MVKLKGMKRVFRISLLLFALLLVLFPLSLEAQNKRGRRTVVSGGLMEKVDSLELRAETIMVKMDSMERASVDSLLLSNLSKGVLDSLERSIAVSDSLYMANIQQRSRDSIALVPDSVRLALRESEKWKFLPDSMSLSKMCWISTVVPGYGQMYNKQYWKLPVLYGTLGAGLALFFNESSKYKPLKKQYEAMADMGLKRTPEQDALQARMIRSNTRRQLYLGATVASYIYFLGDAALSYSTNDVSHVKKATTLSCICPGAGQIYNKSYWKVPFIVGGFASMIYTIDWNNRGYQRFQTAHRLRSDYDKALDEYNKNPEEGVKPEGSTDEFKGNYSAAFLKDLKNQYRRNRDLCLIITAGIYILQIVDAHVDAHLKDYDVSDDLSMSIEPMVDQAYIPSLGDTRFTLGFNLSIKF